jgi:hypothetical protein
MVEQAVEAALVPLTFAVAKGKEDSVPEPSRARAAAADGTAKTPVPGSRRELLALKLVDGVDLLADKDLSALTDLLSVDWIRDQRAHIERVRAQWQKAHRLTIGASFDIISGRLNEEQLKIVEAIALKPSGEAAQLLNDYLSRVLERLLDESLQLWVPLAREFVESRGIADLLPARFMAGVVLPEGGADESYPLQVQTSLVFGRAAVRALELQDANNANRFANLALRAGGADDSEDTIFPRFEREYLCAVTYRFLIGNVGDLFPKRPPKDKGRAPIRRAIAEVKDRYARASRLLHRCISRHFTSREEEFPHRLRYVRALSERASLHLFIASALGLSRTSEEDDLILDALQYVEVAKGDLRICMQYDEVLGADPVAERIRTQYLSNTAAAEVVRCVLLKGRNYRFDHSLDALVPRLVALGADTKGKHALLRAELAGFAVLAGKRVKGLLPSRFGAKVELTMLALPLDRELLDGIERYIL